jgi:hypothetical protein
MKPELELPSRLFRSSVLRSKPHKIDRAGGEYGAGLIRGAAVITRGEALGHGMWIDGEMLSQVADAINAEPKGSKSRFGHPGMSGDALGKAVGRYRNAEIDGYIVRADLHVYSTAHITPEGNLADYVIGLAEEDSEAFGNSIAFDPDYGAELEFTGKHSDKDGNFKSPDSDNSRNLPHARLAELEAVDVVDSPAANPDGLFHRGHDLVLQCDSLFAYALGLGDTAVQCEALGFSADRVKGFVQRFLAEHRLQIVKLPHPAIAAALASVATDLD